MYKTKVKDALIILDDICDMLDIDTPTKVEVNTDQEFFPTDTTLEKATQILVYEFL